MRSTFLLASLVTITAMAQSDERPKAVALVKDAVAVLKKGGKEALVREVQQGRLHTKDENALYVFAYSPDGTCVAHGFKTIYVGTNRLGIKDPDGKKDIKGLLTDLIGKIGENIKVRRFVRYEVGEGLVKRADDFVEEVKRQAGQG